MYSVSEIIEIVEPLLTQKRVLLVVQSQEEHVVHRAVAAQNVQIEMLVFLKQDPSVVIIVQNDHESPGQRLV